MNDFNFWKPTPLPNRGYDDLFVAIVTAQDDRQLIAQCTTLDFAKEIADKHNRFDVELRAAAAERDRLQAVVDAQATQLEQARIRVNDVDSMISAAYDMAYVENASRDVLGMILAIRGALFAAHALAPEAEPHFDSAQKYREALEQIEAVWVSESVNDEHTASLKMYTIAARALNNADDEKVYTVPEAEATK